MKNLDFVAIDLETATCCRNSICEIGIAIVENGKVWDSKSWLVQPPYNEYSGFNVMIHGIHPKDTENCKDFPSIWKEVEPFLMNKVVVAHNASFDMPVLNTSFEEYHMDFPEFYSFCSLRLARKVAPNFDSYKLPEICHSLGIEFGKHHRAGGDAIGCAEVFLKCLEMAQITNWEELQEKYNFTCGAFLRSEYRPIRSNKRSSKNN